MRAARQKSTLGEGSDIPAEIGTTVKITATPYDAEKYPGMEGGIIHSVYPVKLIAHWSASPVAKPDPDEPIDEDFGVEPAPMDTTGGAIAAVAVGGAAIWGGYEIATRIILNGLLPEGRSHPANRGQLALVVWNTGGTPNRPKPPRLRGFCGRRQR